MKNIEIRQVLLMTGIRQWNVAERMNMSESAFSKMLRNELPKDQKEKIFKIIDELAAGE